MQRQVLLRGENDVVGKADFQVLLDWCEESGKPSSQFPSLNQVVGVNLEQFEIDQVVEHEVGATPATKHLASWRGVLQKAAGATGPRLRGKIRPGSDQPGSADITVLIFNEAANFAFEGIDLPGGVDSSEGIQIPSVDPGVPGGGALLTLQIPVGFGANSQKFILHLWPTYSFES